MRDIDYIIDFAIHLGRELLFAGANLERANDTMERVCKAYSLHEVSIFSLSSTITLSAKTLDGETHIRQLAVPGTVIHLEKLRKLNRLSYQVCTNTPSPERLEDMLYQAVMVPSYTPLVEMCAYVLAITCLCRIFGGHVRELVVIAITTIIAYWMSRPLARANLNRIITNGVNMFVTASIFFFTTWVGFTSDMLAMLTAMSLMFIPGVPLVNAMRNILCGNEMNGILEFIKVLLETLTICLGVFVAYALFGRWYTW